MGSSPAYRAIAPVSCTQGTWVHQARVAQVQGYCRARREELQTATSCMAGRQKTCMDREGGCVQGSCVGRECPPEGCLVNCRSPGLLFKLLVAPGDRGVLSQRSSSGHNPTIGCRESNDLQTSTLSNKQRCDRTSRTAGLRRSARGRSSPRATGEWSGVCHRGATWPSGLGTPPQRRDQRLKLGERQAGARQELRGAGLQSGTSDTSHAGCLLSWEAQEIINRDNLNYVDEILHVDLYRWTPIMGWDKRWYQCILSSKATTRASEKSQQNLRHHCPIL